MMRNRNSRDVTARRRLLCTAASGLALGWIGAVAVPARAQTTPAPATEGAMPASPPAASAAAGTPATVVDDDQIESLLGKKVKSPSGDDMGRIVDILVDRTGAVRAAVVDFGGFFGVGTRKIAVDWGLLHFGAGAKADAVKVDLSPDRLRLSPVYKEGEPVVILGTGTAASAAPSAPSAAPAPAAGSSPPAMPASASAPK